MMKKPYAESCEQNKEPILSIIKPLLRTKKTVLEIGSGTGQHAVFFAQQMPHLLWQPSDKAENLAGINMWIEESGLENIEVPLELDVMQENWPGEQYDVIYTANTLHIMHWNEVEEFFKKIKKILKSDGFLIIYGPFNYNYKYTSDSNARFDDWLKARDPKSGIRHFEDINELASLQNLILHEDYAMPANNRTLCWQMS